MKLISKFVFEVEPYILHHMQGLTRQALRIKIIDETGEKHEYRKIFELNHFESFFDIMLDEAKSEFKKRYIDEKKRGKK